MSINTYWKGNQKMYFENGLGISLILNHINERHEILVIQNPSTPDDKLVAPRYFTDPLLKAIAEVLSELSSFDAYASTVGAPHDYGLFEYLTDQDVLIIINRISNINSLDIIASRI
jgi:hypothetical protein